MRLRAACVQMSSGPDMAANLGRAAELGTAAADRGAGLIAFPENVALMVQGRDRVLAAARPEEEHPAVPAFAALARATGAWILAGSIAVRAGGDRLANRSLLFEPGGRIAARYDKIHLFDVDLADGESYRESATFTGGRAAVVADTPWGGLGMTVCYDVRFPDLHRALAKAGALILTVPAAFTVPTGSAHWHVLLRARAIETGCFVLAPAQTGRHDGGRRTFGHSLIVDPWGEILSDGGEGEGVVIADLDLLRVADARQRIPALQHDRPFAVQNVSFP